jgi:methylated-DNA-[protein]-cysteine S-methyltransferase
MKIPPPLGFSTFPTPLGKFSIAVTPTGCVAATAFGGKAALSRRLGGERLVRDSRGCAPARAQVEEWFRGARRRFSLRLRPSGTPFQRRVWSALSRIPFGQTRSYDDIAGALRSSARAVGRANATNPICLLVPCHRVIGSDGSLTGFAFGLTRKRRLLSIEREAFSG